LRISGDYFVFSSSALGLIIIITFYGVGYLNLTAGSQDLVFSVKDNPYNKTFAEWASWWWNHHLSIADIKTNKSLSHPRDNYSPEKCSWAQDNGPVWFLPDGKDQSDATHPEIRQCKVPEGKALLVQIVGSGCSKGENPEYTEEDLLNCAVWVLPSAQFSAKIDGKEVMNTVKDPSDRQKFYVEPYKTNLTYVKNSYYDNVKPGTYPGIVGGYYLFVPPLSRGLHEIQFDETAIKFLNAVPSEKRISNVKYLITVE
jgi:hypothetical protein